MRTLAAIILFFSLFGRAYGQAVVALSPVAHQQFLDNNANPLSGGFVFTYIAGTTTPQATYSDSSGVSQNTNPIILNSGGFANIWLDASKVYKFVVKSSASVTQYTVDNISAFPQAGKFLAGDGTVGAPSWSFSAETNTGMYRASAGNVAFSILGTKTLNLSASSLSPGSAGLLTLGTGALPYSSLFVGAAATNNAKITGTFTAARVFTLPDTASDNFLLASAVQNVTGKTFTDIGDPTKKLTFSLSGITTGITGNLAYQFSSAKTITFPDLTGVLATINNPQTWSGGAQTNMILAQPTVNTGISQGSGLKHQRFGVSCTTGAADGSICNTTYTWTNPFADANYTVACSIDSAGVSLGTPVVLGVTATTASQIQVTIASASAVAAQAPGIGCIAMHD
jgi:hypothetical protein